MKYCLYTAADCIIYLFDTPDDLTHIIRNVAEDLTQLPSMLFLREPWLRIAEKKVGEETTVLVYHFMKYLNNANRI